MTDYVYWMRMRDLRPVFRISKLEHGDRRFTPAFIWWPNYIICPTARVLLCK